MSTDSVRASWKQQPQKLPMIDRLGQVQSQLTDGRYSPMSWPCLIQLTYVCTLSAHKSFSGAEGERAGGAFFLSRRSLMTARPPSTNSEKKHGTALLGFLVAVAVIITHQPSRNIPTGRAIYKSITDADKGGSIRSGFEHVFTCSPTFPSDSSVYFFCCCQ